jgi:hypothetical protein
MPVKLTNLALDCADAGPAWMFVRVPEGKTVKNRLHPDLVTTDLAAEVDRILGLGADQQAEHDQGGYRWYTLTDPEGNEFDVITRETETATEDQEG